MKPTKSSLTTFARALSSKRLRRGLLNNDELEKAAEDLEAWIERDQEEISRRTETRNRKGTKVNAAVIS